MRTRIASIVTVGKPPRFQELSPLGRSTPEHEKAWERDEPSLVQFLKCVPLLLFCFCTGLGSYNLWQGVTARAHCLQLIEAISCLPWPCAPALVAASR